MNLKNNIAQGKKLRRFISYAVVGFSAFCVEYFSFLALISLFDLGGYPILFAQIISFLLALIVNFYGSRYISFARSDTVYKHGLKRQVTLFLALAFINLMLSSLIIILMVYQLLISAELAKLITMAMVVMWNYLFLNRVIFKSS